MKKEKRNGGGKNAAKNRNFWIRIGALVLAGAMVIGIVASVIASFAY
nr:hypothetical protein [Ndongobacter massiliensis]